jgi:membrane-bound serine protease (ClpP class)
MMRRNVEVYQYTNKTSGERRYMTDDDVKALGAKADAWNRGEMVIESRKEHLLTVAGRRGMELGLANRLADDRPALLDEFQVAGNVKIIEHNWVDITVAVLNWPIVTGLLLIIGLVCLFIEFISPGISFGGLMAGLCFALFFWSKFLGGTADWLELLLFVAGLAFIGVEIFVFPGFGVAGLAGALLMLVSLILASQSFVIPAGEFQVRSLSRTLLTLMGAGFGFVVVAYFIRQHFGTLPVLSKIILTPPPPTEPHEEKPAKPDEEPDGEFADTSSRSSGQVRVGEKGNARTPLRPAGKGQFGDRYLDVVADGEFILAGTDIEVVRIGGNRVVVREATRFDG